MSGDFSRKTFDKTKHYSAVLMQQGRVQLDSDWNEQQAINQYHGETEAADVIGPHGVPLDTQGGGFKIGLSSDAKDLTLSAGRLYVDGTLCENEALFNGNPVSLQNQPDLFVKSGSTAGFTMPTQAGRYLIYVDVWQREITALNDSDTREKALGGPDTAIRTKTVWQIKWFKVANTATCNQFSSGWKPQADATGQLTVRTSQAAPGSTPCILPPKGGYQRLENQLYRVEIHRGGTRSQAQWKWSRDNATVVSKVENVAGLKLKVDSVGSDEILGFSTNQWAEVIDDRMELAGQRGFDDTGEFPDARGHLVQIDVVNGDTHEITIKTNAPLPTIDVGNDPNAPKVVAKLRRWDQTDSSATATGLSMTNTWMLLEDDGVEVQFAEKTADGTANAIYIAGDYWLIPARTAINDETGGIEWPHDAAGNFLPQLPHGITHHYCPLALVDFDGTIFNAATLQDCRVPFLPLTDLTARVLSQQSVCTIVATPGPGWERVFNDIAEGQDAEICFQIGTYILDAAVVLRKKGHLTVNGCGPGTKILAPGSETVMRFEDCKSVTVRNISAMCGVTGTQATKAEEHLNGVLTFYACPDVTIEHVALKCAAGGERAATCITVARAVPNTTATKKPIDVRIQHCDLRVGHMQAGIVLVDVTRARVMDNQLRADKKPKAISLGWLLENRRYRSAIRSLLVHHGRLSWSDEELVGGNPVGVVIAEAGKGKVWFSTIPSLVPIWEAFFQNNPPKGVQNNLDFLRYVYNVADTLLLNQGRLKIGNNAFDEFQPWYAQLLASNRSVASQGIVVAGSLAKDIQIHNNTIYGVLQGIQIGFSVKSGLPTPAVAARRVEISSNYIGVFLAPTVLNRYAIFVGNCDSLTIQHNYAFLRRALPTADLKVEAIRIFGNLGRMMTVRHNHLANFTTGITMLALNQPPGQPQWLITDNLLEGTEPANRVIGPSLILGRNSNYS